MRKESPYAVCIVKGLIGIAVFAVLFLSQSFRAEAHTVQVAVPDGEYQYRPRENYQDLRGWGNCPAGHAVTAARVTDYATKNKNLRHIECSDVAGLISGYDITKEINHANSEKLVNRSNTLPKGYYCSADHSKGFIHCCSVVVPQQQFCWNVAHGYGDGLNSCPYGTPYSPGCLYVALKRPIKMPPSSDAALSPQNCINPIRRW